MEEQLIDTPDIANSEGQNDDWENLPIADSSEFFGKNEPAPTPATPTPSATDEPPVEASVASTNDDGWDDDKPNDSPAAAAPKGLRETLAEQFGITLSEDTSDEVLVSSLKQKLSGVQTTTATDPIAERELLLSLDDRALVKASLMEGMNEEDAEFKTEVEVEEELDRLEDEGRLSARAKRQRSKIESEVVQQKEAQQRAVEEQAKQVAQMTEAVTNAIQNLDIDGIKVPEKQVNTLLNYIKGPSSAYMNRVGGIQKEDGTPMTAADVAETVLWVNPTFRSKFIAQIKAKAAQSAVSDYIKKLEHRASPTETGKAFVAPTGGEMIVSSKEFFG